LEGYECYVSIAAAEGQDPVVTVAETAPPLAATSGGIAPLKLVRKRNMMIVLSARDEEIDRWPVDEAHDLKIGQITVKYNHL
jgi:hypothetical protein